MRSVPAIAALAALSAASPLAIRPRAGCLDQSCIDASLAGASTEPWDGTTIPDGTTADGACCVISYNPAVASGIFANVPAAEQLCGNGTSTEASRMKNKRVEEFNNGMRAMLTRRSSQPLPTSDIIERDDDCTPKTLIYARGTFEVGSFGETVGPVLVGGLKLGAPDDTWTFLGVDFDPSYDADLCLGLPGGAKAKQLLEDTVNKCPDTKLIMAGYSQGAMVVRNAVAYTSPDVASKVAGIYTFGDPFNGAPLKNFAPKEVVVDCADGDGVCTGKFDVTAAHLSYPLHLKDSIAAIQAL